MKTRSFFAINLERSLVIIAVSWPISAGFICSGLGLAQVPLDYEPPQEKDLYDTLPSGTKSDSFLDSANPIDLMNKLRRATAMDDATSPSDAIDRALKVLQVEESNGR